MKNYFSHPKKMSKKEWESGAIFYYDSESQNEQLTEDDLNEFTKLCDDKLRELKKSL